MEDRTLIHEALIPEMEWQVGYEEGTVVALEGGGFGLRVLTSFDRVRETRFRSATFGEALSAGIDWWGRLGTSRALYVVSSDWDAFNDGALK